MSLSRGDSSSDIKWHSADPQMRRSGQPRTTGSTLGRCVMTDDDREALRTELLATAASCRQALASDFSDLLGMVPDLPTEPERWFELLFKIPDDPRSRRALGRWHGRAAPLPDYQTNSIERFGILQAALIALSKLEPAQMPLEIKLQLCATLRRLANRKSGWGRRLQYDSDAFEELARIVSLRRLHAGQISFDVMALPRAWFLRAHPLALPGLVWEVSTELRGLGPIVMPHLNYWRGNPMALLKNESDISHYRIAQYLEQHPDVKGLVSASWLYSSEVETFAPHIAWLRDFYRDNGAYLVDLDLAHEKAGFLVGSEARRQMHVGGRLHPRETLVIWSRDRLLSWASEFAERGDAAPSTPQAARRKRKGADPKWRSRANEVLSSGQYTLIHGGALLRQKPRHYIFLVFIVPLIMVALAAAFGLGFWAVPPALLLSTVIIWILQYFLLQ